jgi:micrococcal nuclease
MYEYKCIIKRVVDGDTVDVDIDLGFDMWLMNQRIRLAGIDTPESRTRDLEEKKFGMFAKYYVQNLIPENTESVIVTRKDDRGKFGRILGDFKVYDPIEQKENLLVEMMLRDSIGVAYEGQNKKEMEKKHLENRKIVEQSEYYRKTITFL